MKFLRKINKGLVLTIIVLIILIVYLVNVEVKRNAEKPNIEQAVKEYIQLVNQYAVLPKEDQKIYGYKLNEYEKLQKELEDKISEHIDKFGIEVNKLTIDNKEVVKIQKGMLESLIHQKSDFIRTVLTEYSREITKIKNFSFDEDQVIVTFDSKLETKNKYIEDEQEQTKLDTQKSENESVTLKLVDGKWKIVYADFMIYSNAAVFDTMF